VSRTTKRDNVLQVRLTPSEYGALEVRAIAQGLAVSTYARSILIADLNVPKFTHRPVPGVVNEVMASELDGTPIITRPRREPDGHSTACKRCKHPIGQHSPHCLAKGCDTEMLSFRIYSHEAQAARRVANRRGSTLSALVRLALARYLAEQGERVNGG